MGDLLEYSFNQEVTYVLICNSGSRATAAIMEIMRLNSKVNIYSLIGGAEAYLS